MTDTMDKSLKACVPRLAAMLGTTPHGLYERQRAMQAVGLLPFEVKPGVGPGSGLRASPEAIATLVLGQLANMKLGEVATLLAPFAGNSGAFVRTLHRDDSGI